MFKSVSFLSISGNPRAFKAIVDHFAATYEHDSSLNESVFRLGGGQLLRVRRLQEGLTFEVTYTDITKFASVTRKLNSRTKSYLAWTTAIIEAPKDLLDLPRPSGELRDPEEVLREIFFLNLESPFEIERKVTLICTGVFLLRSSKSETLSSENAFALLAEWLAFQDARGQLVVPEGMLAAKMLLSMMFGDAALRLQSGLGLPHRDTLLHYLRSCIIAFVSAHRRKR